jgi:Uncharacterised ArCR, COG2043
VQTVPQPDPTVLLDRLRIAHPLIGFYDAPDPAAFAPVVEPKAGGSTCVFDFYKLWLKGTTLHLTADNFGCGGAGRQLFGIETRTRDAFVKFLADDEGLKASHGLMEQWLDHGKTYKAIHAHLFIGLLHADRYKYLRSATFYVNPDQLSALATGAQYHSAPDDPPPVIARFGSGCMQMASIFDDLDVAQAAIGATDIAMRDRLAPELIAFTVTRPMFTRLCSLDERSFLFKPFLERLQKARAKES